MDVIRTRCPSCAQMGGDTKGNNLVTWPDGHSWCFACGYKTGQPQYNPRQQQPLKIDDGLVPAWDFQYRPYLADLLKHFNVLSKSKRTKLGTTLKSQLNKLWYTYYKGHGTSAVLSGLKYRDFDHEALSGEKSTGWCPGSSYTLYGLQLVESKRNLVLVEGENDTIVTYMALWGQDCDVLGISGSDNYRKLKEEMALLSKYEQIFIAFDSDKAGVAATEAAAAILPGKCYRVTWTLKDPCEVFEKYGVAGIQQCVAGATPIMSPCLLTGQQLKLLYLDYLTQNKSSGLVSSYSNLDKMLGAGVKPGELAMFAAHTGRGKSTFVLNWVDSIIDNNPGTRVLWNSTEMSTSQMVHKTLEMRLGKTLTFRDGKLNVEFDILEPALDKLSREFIFYDEQESFDSFIKASIEAIYDGVSVIVIDVLNDIAQSITEWQEARKIMSELNNLAIGDESKKRPPVSVIMVGHTVKNANGKFSDYITLADLKGGSTLQQQCTCILGMNAPPEARSSAEFNFFDKPEREIVLLKRPRLGHSTASVADVWYNFSTMRYEEIK